MLLISLVASLLCFLVASVAMSRQKRSLLGPTLYCALIALFGPMFIGVISLPTLLFAMVLFCMMFCWSQEAWSIRSFRLASLLALFVIYGCFSIRAYYQLNELKQEYAIVQMDERLPKRNPVQSISTDKVILTESSRAQLNDVEDAFLEKDKDEFVNSRVRQAVEALHNNTIGAFAMSPSFGMARMSTTMSILEHYTRPMDQQTRPQGPSQDWSQVSIGSVNELPEPAFQSFDRWLTNSILRFVPFRSLGIRFDNHRVAGFHAHGEEDYALKPEKSHSLALDYAKLEVNRLDLVSLLLHEKPVAYVSDTLPSMANLKKYQTRPLNPFEAVGLLKLQAGESIYVKEYQEHTLVLGALRNAKQCQACHEGERGKLLGAFSYDLVRTK